MYVRLELSIVKQLGLVELGERILVADLVNGKARGVHASAHTSALQNQSHSSAP